MVCECIYCYDCKGTGVVWVDDRGRPVRNHCCNLDNPEPCDECDGTGIAYTCEKCSQEIQDEHDQLAQPTEGSNDG